MPIEDPELKRFLNRVVAFFPEKRPPPERIVGTEEMAEMLRPRPGGKEFKPGKAAAPAFEDWGKKAIHAIAIAQGDRTGVAGEPFGHALEVTVTNTAGGAVPDASVLFAVSGGGGRIADGRRKTDANGIARLPAGSWVLGSGGDDEITVRSGTKSTKLEVRTAMHIAATSPKQSELHVGRPKRFEVKVTDRRGEPVRNVRVRFEASNGVADLVTDAQGVVTTEWIWHDAHQHTLTASIGAFKEQFSANVTNPAAAGGGAVVGP